jgi:hypothetical protein
MIFSENRKPLFGIMLQASAPRRIADPGRRIEALLNLASRLFDQTLNKQRNFYALTLECGAATAPRLFV